MDDERARWEFERIELRTELERDKTMIRQYEEGLAFRRDHLEVIVFELGKLEERLGGGEL